MIYFRCNNSR